METALAFEKFLEGILKQIKTNSRVKTSSILCCRLQESQWADFRRGFQEEELF